MSINALTADVREQVDAFLKQQLARHSINETLRRAMEHGVLLGGKRVRPYLLMTIAEICRGDKQAALTAAGAIELIHAYSLIHDDLPAMDNDELRRGQPTCHIAFDEATAIFGGRFSANPGFRIIVRMAVRWVEGRASVVYGECIGSCEWQCRNVCRPGN